MDPREVADSDEELQLVDVREDHEWQAGHIPAARHLVLAELPDRLAEIDGDRPVVMVCRSGNRSAKAARLLAAHGYDARNLDGGMLAWVDEGLPAVADDGGAGGVV